MRLIATSTESCAFDVKPCGIITPLSAASTLSPVGIDSASSRSLPSASSAGCNQCKTRTCILEAQLAAARLVASAVIVAEVRLRYHAEAQLEGLRAASSTSEHSTERSGLCKRSDRDPKSSSGVQAAKAADAEGRRVLRVSSRGAVRGATQAPCVAAKQTVQQDSNSEGRRTLLQKWIAGGRQNSTRGGSAGAICSGTRNRPRAQGCSTFSAQQSSHGNSISSSGDISTCPARRRLDFDSEDVPEVHLHRW